MILIEDFVLALDKLGLGKIGASAARKVFKQFDRNGNGKLDLSEALAALEKISHILPAEKDHKNSLV